MSSFEAFILGIIQGLTEFLPVSSSGHLELGKAILGIELKESLTFTVVVHGATVLSTIVVFHKEIWQVLMNMARLKNNEEARFGWFIALSMVPVLVVGLFFKDAVESLFDGNIFFVGCMLLVTGLLLTFSGFSKNHSRPITPLSAFVIGLSQAFAVLPGISRSGATISTALMLGVNREKAARFSFLMVLVPILGANFLDLLDYEGGMQDADLQILLIGFIAAFLSGWIACRWMIKIVKRGKLIWFAIYCFLVGTIAIVSSLLV